MYYLYSLCCFCAVYLLIYSWWYICSNVGIAGWESLNRWWSHCLILLTIWRCFYSEAQMEHCQTVTPRTTYLSAETVLSNQLNWPFVMNSAMADLIGTYFGVFSSCRSWSVTHADIIGNFISIKMVILNLLYWNISHNGWDSRHILAYLYENKKCLSLGGMLR